MAGELSLSSAFQLDELGPTRGEPVTVSWPWTNHLWLLLPLGLLALPLLLRRNRNRGAAAVWLPVLALYFFWIPLAWIFGQIESDLEITLGVFALGLGVTCAVVPWIAAGSWLRTWLSGLLVALVVELLALACFSGGNLGRFASVSVPLVIPALGTSILITGVVLAARGCRERVSAGRFLLRLLLWLLLFSAATVLVIAILEGILYGSLSGGGASLVILYLFSALLLGLICFAGIAPFLLLALASGTYRERFRVAFVRG